MSAKDYNAQLAEFARRRELAHQMRDAGTNLENIAAVLGVTKQRISQMLAGRDRCPTCGHVRKKRKNTREKGSQYGQGVPSGEPQGNPNEVAQVRRPDPKPVARGGAGAMESAPQAAKKKRAPRKLTLAEIVASTVKSS